MAIPLEDCAELPIARVGGKARALAEALTNGFPVPPGVVLEPLAPVDVAAVAATLGDGPYAVRSSSPHEDRDQASWAGQFRTRLWVEAADLAAAVEEVRESGRGPAPRAYGSSGERIPVLVQPIVEADAAGVMFTIDPRDGRDDRSVVEVVSGLAEQLVDGRETPARFVVDAVSEQLVESEGATGAPLTDLELKQVVALGLRVSEWRGVPLDVEWAWALGRPWLLQARPITAAAWSPAPGQWTAANFKEVMPGVVTPLTASIGLEHEFPRAVSEFVCDLGLGRRGELVTEGRRFYGHAYWRVDALKQRMLRLPRFRERSFDDTIGITPSYAGEGRTSALTPATLWRALPALWFLQRAYRREGPAAGRYRDAFAREEQEWLAIDFERLPADELARCVREAVDQHWRTNRWAMRVSFLSQQAQDDLRLLLLALARRVQPPPSESRLLSSVADVATGAGARALAALADRVGSDRDRVLAARTPGELPAPVRAEFEALVERFGYMAAADEELAQPRWEDDPSLPLALLKAAVSGPGRAERPPEHDEEARLARAAGRRRRSLRRKAARARRYAWWREEMRDVLARTDRLTRRAFKAQGRRWAAAGMLEHEDDVFWLRAGEVLAMLDGTQDLDAARARTAARRRHSARFRNWRPPATLGRHERDARPAAERVAAERAARRAVLRGTPCSAGVVEGRVAVLRSLADAPKVPPGSVLVLEYSNPGWTPVYAVAAALVTEEGGLLSHGSIVARERGLPAVIQVPGATSTLHDGERVRVDGDGGTVTRLDRAIEDNHSEIGAEDED